MPYLTEEEPNFLWAFGQRQDAVGFGVCVLCEIDYTEEDLLNRWRQHGVEDRYIEFA